MDFIVPIILSFILAPIVGLGCAFIVFSCLCTFLAIKRRRPSNKTWTIAFTVFAVCTCAAPLILFMGWAISLDLINSEGQKITESTSKEFWQEFTLIERDLHTIESENDPAYQKLKLLVDKYLWHTSAIVGARHGTVRELSFNESRTRNGNPKADTSKLISGTALIDTVPTNKFKNWLIGSGFDKPYNRDSVFTHRRTGPNKYFAKDVLFFAYRDKKRINVDIYTDIDISQAYDNTPPVTAFLKENLGGQFFYLVLGDVKFHPLSEKGECKVQPVDKIHQAFVDLLTASELKSLEEPITDYICVQSMSRKDCRIHKQYNNPFLRAPVYERTSTYHYH